MIPFFVYGDLKKGNIHYNKIMKSEVERVVKAELRNHDMYSIDNYPGVIKGDGVVQGEVIFVNPQKYLSIIQELDNIKEYNVSQKRKSPFLREIKRVVMEDGKKIDAYVYTFNERFLKDNDQIKSGDWDIK